MSQPLTITLLIVCGLVLGLGLASMLDEQDARNTNAAQHGSLAATETSLLRIEGLLASLLAGRQTGVPQPAAVQAPVATGPTLAPTERASAPPTRTSIPEPRVALNESGPTGGLLPEPRAERLAKLGELGEWEENQALRRQWMFTSERQALNWFGTPDEVSTNGSNETWVYEGREESEGRRFLMFSRGRLIRIQ